MSNDDSVIASLDPSPAIKFPLSDGSTANVEFMLADMDPVEQICRRMEAVAEEEGWDARPQYFSLARIGDVPVSLDEMTTTDGNARIGALAISEMALPDFCYEDPGAGLGTFFGFLVEEPDSEEAKHLVMKAMNVMVPFNFYGFGLINEGWTLPDTVPDDERKEHSREHTMYQHPDRVEIRVLTLATCDGRMITMIRQRGETPHYTEVDISEGDDLYGRVPNGIRMLTSLFEHFDEWRRPVWEQYKAEQLGG